MRSVRAYVSTDVIRQQLCVPTPANLYCMHRMSTSVISRERWRVISQRQQHRAWDKNSFAESHLCIISNEVTTRVSRYQKGKTNLDFTEARYSEWQWHPLGHMQICISLQTDNHASTPPLNFLQAGCPSCRPTNSVKALVALVSFREHTEKTRERSIWLTRSLPTFCSKISVARYVR